MKKIIILIIAILLIILAFLYFSKENREPKIPEYVEQAVENDSVIALDAPLPNDVVENPLVISGRARGQWYFEGSFPVLVKNSSGSVIGRGTAEAEGEWMTEELVPFKGSIDYTDQPAGSTGSLVLERSNASGLPENSETLEIPIIFGE